MSNFIDSNQPSTEHLLQQYISGEMTPEEGHLFLNRIETSPGLGKKLFQQMETEVLLEAVVGEEASFHNSTLRESSEAKDFLSPPSGFTVERRNRLFRVAVISCT